MTDKLLDQLAAPENLLSAWRSVRGNIPRYRRERSCGPDGVTLTDFERDLPAQLEALRDMLVSERYQPAPPKRVALPKRGGGQRVISLLDVRERVAQRAAQQVIEPLWEPEFLPCSFGFRPGVSLEQAVVYVHEQRDQDSRWVVDGDIAACFDSLDHELLMARIKRKISDGRLLHLLQDWLDAGVMQSGPPLNTLRDSPSNPAAFASLFRRGLDWVVELLADENSSPYSYQPYQAARFEAPREDAPSLPGAVSYGEELNDYRRRSVLKRLAANGLLLGAEWIRPAMKMIQATARNSLSTPANRRLVKKGALTSGGLAGLAAAAAVTAYFLQRKAGPSPVGVLQGSPVSPLLANIYLHPFDVMLTRKRYHLARFADDWVILCPTQEEAETAYNEALRALSRLKLKANPDKTRILSPSDKLEWLGVIIN